MAKRARDPIVLRPATVRAILSPLRLEILEALAPDARLTVTEIATRIGRRAGSLYYHVNALVAAGVIAECERRLVGRRWVSRYRLTRERIALGVDVQSPASIAAAAHGVRAMLRLTAREFEASLRRGPLHDADKPIAIGQRMKAHLRDDELQRVRRHLDAIEAVFVAAKSRSSGALYALTAVLLPVAAATRKAGKARKARGARTTKRR